MDARDQESSRASTSDAIILYIVEFTKPLLHGTITGALATTHRILGAFIENIWLTTDDEENVGGPRWYKGRLSLNHWLDGSTEVGIL